MVAVDENEWTEDSRHQHAAELDRQWRQRAAAEAEWWEKRAAAQQDEKLRQDNLMYGGLIVIGIYMVQPFLTAAPDAFNLTAKICVIAFAIAIPILAALVVLNSQEIYRGRAVKSGYVQVTRQAALGVGFVGVVAGFWHLTWIAGVAALVATMIAVSIYSVGFVRIERDDAKGASRGEATTEPR